MERFFLTCIATILVWMQKNQSIEKILTPCNLPDEMMTWSFCSFIPLFKTHDRGILREARPTKVWRFLVVQRPLWWSAPVKGCIWWSLKPHTVAVWKTKRSKRGKRAAGVLESAQSTKLFDCSLMFMEKRRREERGLCNSHLAARNLKWLIIIFCTGDTLRHLEDFVPFAVRSIDCFPEPRREWTPGTHDGTSLSRIGPICLHIRSKWSGAICLLAATCRGRQRQQWKDTHGYNSWLIIDYEA